MHGRTRAALEELEKAPWFVNVGVKSTTAAIIISSWKEALDYCGSDTWQNVILEAANGIRDRLIAKSIAEYNRWNSIAAQIKPLTDELAREMTSTVIQQNKLP